MGNFTSMTLGATSRTFTYQNQTPRLSTVTETGIGSRTVGYDSAGNESVQGGTYGYSPRNLLGTVAGSTGALIRARLGHAAIHQTPADPTTVYTYDGRGIRVKLSQTSGNTTQERSFLYDDAMRLIAETTYQAPPSTAIQYEYIWFNGQPVAQETIGGSTAWTVTDHLGTPFLQTNASGTVIWRVEYEPYGEVFSLRSGSDRHQPLRLPGQEAEQLDIGVNGDSERSYNIFRWYRPKWGRYTQADPIKAVGLLAGYGSRRTFSLPDYGYAANDPLSFVDPLGLCTKCDDCPSGKWSYNGFPAMGATVFKGVTSSNGTFRCIGKPDVGLSVTVSCEVSGPIFGAGWGFETSPWKAGCGCNRKDLLGTSSGTVVSALAFSVSRTTSTTDPDCSTYSGGLAKSWGGGIGRIECVVEPRHRGWWEPDLPGGF